MDDAIVISLSLLSPMQSQFREILYIQELSDMGDSGSVARENAYMHRAKRLHSSHSMEGHQREAENVKRKGK